MKGFLFFLSLWLTVVSTFAQRTPLKVNGTVVNNPNLTNSATVTYAVNGANVTATAAGSSGTVGTVINTGVSGVGKVPAYTDATGTNVAPFTALTLSGTNASLVGVLTANGVNATNFLRLNGVDVMTTSSSANDVRGSGTTTANDLAVFTDTTHTNIARSTSAANLGDSSSATFAVNFGLSGATDPVITAGNNLLTVSTPLTIGNGSAASYVVTGDVSGTDTTLTFGSSLATFSSGVTLGGNLSLPNSSTVVFGTRGSIFQSGDGVTTLRNNAASDYDRLQFGGTSSSFPALKRSGTGLIVKLADDSANAPFTASTLTLTPSAADTTAWTLNGFSNTGSGAATGVDLSGTWNTSGNPTFVDINITNAASGSTAKIATWRVGGTTLGFITKAGGIASSSGVSVGTTSDSLVAAGTLAVYSSSNGKARLSSAGGEFSSDTTLGFRSATSFLSGTQDALFARDAAATIQMGADAASPVAQKFKAHDGSGTDIAGANLTIAGGQSTGTGRGGAAIIQTSPSGSTGSSANAYSERAHYAAKAVTLTESTATTVATIALTAAQFVGTQFTVTVFASDGTDHQARTLRFGVSAVNKAGTVTAAIDTPDESVAVSAGTLTATITAVANGNAVDVKVDATSSLTQTTLNATVAIPAINGNGTAAVTEI